MRNDVWKRMAALVLALTALLLCACEPNGREEDTTATPIFHESGSDGYGSVIYPALSAD